MYVCVSVCVCVCLDLVLRNEQIREYEQKRGHTFIVTEGDAVAAEVGQNGLHIGVAERSQGIGVAVKRHRDLRWCVRNALLESVCIHA